MERILKHPERGTLTISREGDVVSGIDSYGNVVIEQVCRTEITAKAFEVWLLHHYADLGYKPAT